MVVLHRRPFHDATEFYEKQERAELIKNAPTLRRDDLAHVRVILPESIGLLRFRLFEEILENGFGEDWRREYLQRDYHELCTQAIAPLIIGDDWDRVGPELCVVRGWKYLSPVVLCKLARQIGKSVATAQVIVAMACAFTKYPPRTEFKIASFSTGKRATGGLRRYCLRLLQASGYDAWIDEQNQEEISLKTGDRDSFGPKIRINFYPSNATISLLVFFFFFFFSFSFSLSLSLSPFHSGLIRRAFHVGQFFNSMMTR